MAPTWGLKKWAAPVVALGVVVLGLALPRHWQSGTETTVAADATIPPYLRFGHGGAATPPPPLTPANAIVVYVCGAVKKPGVYRLRATDRVYIAIAKAGGAAQKAHLEQVNLAEPLTDAMKIDVPPKDDLPADSRRNVVARIYSRASRRDVPAGIYSLSSRGDVGAGNYSRASRRNDAGDHGKLEAGQTLDVNRASAAELMRLPGVGPGLAARIVAYREQYGPFQTVDDLQNVSGIGPSKFERLAPYVRL